MADDKLAMHFLERCVALRQNALGLDAESTVNAQNSLAMGVHSLWTHADWRRGSIGRLNCVHHLISRLFAENTAETCLGILGVALTGDGRVMTLFSHWNSAISPAEIVRPGATWCHSFLRFSSTVLGKLSPGRTSRIYCRVTQRTGQSTIAC